MKTDFILYFNIVLLPLVFSNVIHIIIVKNNIFNILSKPISKTLFGINKTWRGFLIVPILNMFFVFAIVNIYKLVIDYPLIIGFVLGLTYMLSELPNSFIKRKLNIPSGGFHKKYKTLFAIIDKTDASFGVAFVYFLFNFVNCQTAIFIFIINSLTHVIISILLVKLKIKKSF